MNAISQSNASNLSRHRQPISGTKLWTGRILSGIAAAFFLLDGGMKLAKPAFVIKATLQLGFPESAILSIGFILLACTALYLIPRTAILGAVLLTGYLGGAVASEVRVSASWFNILFPIGFACVVWIGLYLRETRLSAILA
jgi:hypothetical protein